MTEPTYRPTDANNPAPTPGPAPVWQPDVAPPPPGPAFAVQAVKPRRNRLDLLLAVAAVIAIGGVAFAAGRMTAPASSQGGLARGTFGANGLPGQDTNRTGAFAGGNGLGGAAAIKGQVVAVTADQLTLKLTSGQTVQIALAATTAFHQEAAAASANVATGSTVLVQLAPRTPTPGQSPGAPFAPGQGGPGGSGAPGGASLGAATDVTIVGP